MLAKTRFRIILLPLFVLLNLTLIPIYRIEYHQDATAEDLVTYWYLMGWDVERILEDKLPTYKQIYPDNEVYPSVWITASYYADPNHTLKYDVYALTIYRRVYGPIVADIHWTHNPTIPYVALVVTLDCVIFVAAFDPEEMLKQQRNRRKPLFHGVCGLYFSEILMKGRYQQPTGPAEELELI